MSTLLAHRFRLLEPIGAGGSGTVWRAWDRRLRRVVAAKVLPSYAVRAPLAPDHPHLLTPYARVEDGATVVAATHLVRGGTVERLLAERGALPGDYVAVLLDQLLRALAALHRAGLVHRDVKPANLLLEPTGAARPRLWLADLDLVAPVGGSVRGLTEGVGTPGYLTPELPRDGPPDPRHDLFAAGVTAVELLTGLPPRRPRDLPRGRLRPLLSALVDPDPACRPSTAGDALTALRGAGVPVGTPWRAGGHPPVVPDRWRRRRSAAEVVSRASGC